MSDAEKNAIRQKNRRNLAIGIGVAAFVILIYLVTILRIDANIAQGAP